MWEGCNFKIKIRKLDGFSNYDKSEFETPSALHEDDAKMEEIWKSEHSLEEFTDAKNFKTYAELKEKMDRVLGLTTSTVATEDVPFDGGKPMTAEQAAVKPPETASPVVAETAGDSEEYSYFAKLAESD